MIFYIVDDQNFSFWVPQESCALQLARLIVVLEQATVVCQDDKGLRSQNERKVKEAEKYFLVSCFWQRVKTNIVLLSWVRCGGSRKHFLQNQQWRHNIYLGFRGDRTSKNICYHPAISPLKKRRNWGQAYGICLCCPRGNTEGFLQHPLHNADLWLKDTPCNPCIGMYIHFIADGW